MLPSLDPEGWGRLEPQVHDLGRAPPGGPQMGRARGGQDSVKGGGAALAQLWGRTSAEPGGQAWATGVPLEPRLLGFARAPSPSFPVSPRGGARSVLFAPRRRLSGHSWTDAASGQTTPRAPVDLISPGSPARPGSSLRPAPPRTPSPPRCLCAQPCDCAVAAARTPALEHSRLTLCVLRLPVKPAVPPAPPRGRNREGGVTETVSLRRREMLLHTG